MHFTLKALGLGLIMTSGVAMAEITDFDSFNAFVKEKNIMPECSTCHAVDAKKIGPSYNAVALHYKDKEGAAAELAKKITEGGSGVWGPAMMTPNASAKDHTETLVKWILSLNPEGDAKADAEKEIAAMPKAEAKAE